MSIEKYSTKGGQRYRAVFEFRGQRFKQRGFLTQKEANDWVTDERRALESEEKRGKVLHLSEFVRQYFEAEAGRLDLATLNYKRSRVQAFFDHLGNDLPVEDVTRDVAAHFQRAFAKDRSQTTVNRYIRDLKTLWNWHITNTGVVTINPFKLPKLPEAQYIPYIPPKEDIDKG